MDKADRKDNHAATGSLLQRVAAIGEFFDYALERTDNQNDDDFLQAQVLYGRRVRSDLRITSLSTWLSCGRPKERTVEEEGRGKAPRRKHWRKFWKLVDKTQAPQTKKHIPAPPCM